MKKAGRIFVISSPSGGGKTTLCNRLKKERFAISCSVSATTRPSRAGEKDGVDYIFLSKERFRRLVGKKKFLEWTNNFGDLYGTPRGFVDRALKRGEDVMLPIDVKGAMRVKRLYPDAVLIFVVPPSLALLKRRLMRRKTEGREAAAKRLATARKEMAYVKKYDYAIVNDNLKRAVGVLKSIIAAERSRVK
jgi:guanylate kinase